MDDEFRRSYRFCRYCGGPLREASSLPVRLMCDECGRTMFLNPKLGVALLIEHDGALLLARRAEEPYKGWWVLPSGYVEYEESCEQAAVREASEELSTKAELQGLQGVYSYGDDPRSRMVLVVYRAVCDPESVRAGDDVGECGFFRPNDLPSAIAFDGVRQAIAAWLKGLQR
jgi:ADP-ribose pyrophosphatase YjhB (NUDIX family)